MEIMHPESGEMIVLRVGKQILKRAFLKHEHPNRFEMAECLVEQLTLSEYIDTSTKETLPPRMLSLGLKDKVVAKGKVDGNTKIGE